MLNCPACSRSVPADSVACPHCGQGLVPDATVLSSIPSPPREVSRFDPGAIIKDRYRIVARLGQGGMGDVFRADDLKLGQSVALKFLHSGFEQDPARLRRLFEEVRTARQVTHPNVCRVHDIDEFAGHHFLSMEYVDGEDLASLLRRIGRLPEERAVEVARQICAGLHAAHEAGVLHRDLKPANVMLDGRGRVRLTDFGLASLAEEAARDIKSGTPAYMAPEQLSGEGVSVASDVYALGLVLYELFTGRPVFSSDNAAELRTMHASQSPSRPSSYVDSLDPAVERAVLRCLEKDPAARPASALSVAAALPGGDPLAAALAAGETPSPELVAEAGIRDAQHPAVAWGLSLLGLGLFLAGSWWAASQSLIAWLPFEKRPEVLEDRAHDLIGSLGYDENVYVQPTDSAWGWLTWSDVLRDVAARDSTAARWEAVRQRPDAGGYWYRQSPAPLLPTPRGEPLFLRGAVQLTDPPPLTAGEVMVLFDLDGRLRRFEMMPRRFASQPPSEPDWTPLFAAAGLDTSRFRPVRPAYQRFSAPDLRRAWVGTLPERPDIEYRVDAGASEGRPILFNVTDVATLQGLAAPPEAEGPSLASRFLTDLPGLAILAVLILLTRLAAYNLRRDRADLRGAWRFGVLLFLIVAVSAALISHALTTRYWVSEVWNLLGAATFVGLLAWMMYTAVEPVGRQVWPTMFVASSRLLSRERSHLRDPLLGRSVLVGLIGGSAYFLAAYPLVRWIAQRSGGPAPWPFGIDLDLLQDGTGPLGSVLELSSAVGVGFLCIAGLVLLQRGVRRRWLAVAIALFLWSVMMGFGGFAAFIRNFALAGVMMVVLLRWGSVAMIITLVVVPLAWKARAVDYGHWTSVGALYALAVALAMAVYGAWAATGRSIRSRPVVRPYGLTAPSRLAGNRHSPSTAPRRS